MEANKEISLSDAKLAEIELQLKRKELDIKDAELAKLNDKPHRVASSPLMIAVLTGILGLLGAGVANVIQSRSNMDLERQKLESSLILKAIETGNTDASAKNLLFLLEMQLISDPKQIIAKLKANPQDAPVLSRPSSNVPVPISASGREIFFNKYAEEFSELEPDKRAIFERLFSFFEKEKEISDIRHVAYILATIKWETGDKWQPISEFGEDSVLEARYGPGTTYGRLFENDKPGDGARYKGRGYIQLTGRKNYKKMSDQLGLTNTENDLVMFPEKALDPLIAYRVTSAMMRMGEATGKKLEDFIHDDVTDYLNARRVINGLDQAKRIEGIAQKFELILRASLEENKSRTR